MFRTLLTLGLNTANQSPPLIFNPFGMLPKFWYMPSNQPSGTAIMRPKVLVQLVQFTFNCLNQENNTLNAIIHTNDMDTSEKWRVILWLWVFVATPSMVIHSSTKNKGMTHEAGEIISSSTYSSLSLSLSASLSPLLHPLPCSSLLSPPPISLCSSSSSPFSLSLARFWSSPWSALATWNCPEHLRLQLNVLIISIRGRMESLSTRSSHYLQWRSSWYGGNVDTSACYPRRQFSAAGRYSSRKPFLALHCRLILRGQWLGYL